LPGGTVPEELRHEFRQFWEVSADVLDDDDHDLDQTVTMLMKERMIMMMMTSDSRWLLRFSQVVAMMMMMMMMMMTMMLIWLMMMLMMTLMTLVVVLQRHRSHPLRGRNVIVRSVCPQIYGMLTVKLAILLTVIGGIEQVGTMTMMMMIITII
jgi:hypothetical protein